MIHLLLSLIFLAVLGGLFYAAIRQYKTRHKVSLVIIVAIVLLLLYVVGHCCTHFYGFCGHGRCC